MASCRGPATVFLFAGLVLVVVNLVVPASSLGELSAHLRTTFDNRAVREPQLDSKAEFRHRRETCQFIPDQADCEKFCFNNTCNRCSEGCKFGCQRAYSGSTCREPCPCEFPSDGCEPDGTCSCPNGTMPMVLPSGIAGCVECSIGTFGKNCLGQCTCGQGEECQKDTGVCKPLTTFATSCPDGQTCSNPVTTVPGATTPTPGVLPPSLPPPSPCQMDSDCSSGQCQNGACSEDTSSDSSSQKTIIIAVSVTVIALLLVFVTAILLILRRVHTMPSATHETHVHVHNASSGSYNDLLAKADASKLHYTSPIRHQDPMTGQWVGGDDHPEDYTSLEQTDDAPTYTPLLKMPSGPPPPLSSIRSPASRERELQQSDNGAAYAHTQILKPHEEPCYRVLELPLIKDPPPPVAAKRDNSTTLPHTAALGYAQLAKDKPLLHASRSMSVSALNDSKQKQRPHRASQVSRVQKVSLPDLAASQEQEKQHWKRRAAQQHEEV